MRILWVKVGGLWPLESGGRLRSFHLLRDLSLRHEVTLVTTHGDDDDPAGLRAELPSCEVVSYPHAAPKVGTAGFALALARSWLSRLPVDLWRWRVPSLREDVARRLRTRCIDVCVADFLAAASNVPRAVGVPTLLFEHNVEHLIWQRLAAAEARPLRRGLIRLESRKLRRFEARACQAADLTVAVSREDRIALERIAPLARVRSISTGVDVEYFHPNGAPRSPREIVFTGSMDWFPNEDAMLHFIGEILPRIRREIPDATLTVAGRKPSPRLRAAAAGAEVRVTGSVADLRGFLDAAAVCVVPLRVGGGTRLKILEALAMAKAVVSTRVGAEGLPLAPGEHYVEADGPEAFARAVVSLLEEPARRAALGSAGRDFVLARCSWPSVAREMEACLEEATACA